MKAVIVMPARLASTRLPNKLLCDVHGKTVLQRAYENARLAKNAADVLIACDDDLLMANAASFGAAAYLTSKDHQSGTDRIAELLPKTDAEIIVNVQSDEPLLDPSVIEALIDAMRASPEASMGTAVIPIHDKTDVTNPNVVKCVVDNAGFAVYFSRAAVPFDRDNAGSVPYLKHFGIYAYRRDFLAGYKTMQSSYLEKYEKLEQLRAISNGHKIKVIKAEIDSVGVDTQADLDRVREIVAKRGS
jgi:3-deoxy-manno-octulosonate cytidylyltransferase (CMP-KDO synthetase)